jgi:hypothetical protein
MVEEVSGEHVSSLHRQTSVTQTRWINKASRGRCPGDMAPVNFPASRTADASAFLQWSEPSAQTPLQSSVMEAETMTASRGSMQQHFPRKTFAWSFVQLCRRRVQVRAWEVMSTVKNIGMLYLSHPVLVADCLGSDRFRNRFKLEGMTKCSCQLL